MKSLQKNLTLNLAVGALVLLTLAAVSIDRLLSNELRHDFDANLLAKARIIAGLVEREGRTIEVDRISGSLPAFESTEPLEYYSLFAPGGNVIQRSSPASEFLMPEATEAGSRPRFRNIELPGSAPGRLVTFSFEPRLEGEPTQVEEPTGGNADTTGGAGELDNPASGDDDEVTYQLTPAEAAGNVRVSIILARDTTLRDQLIFGERMILGGGFALLVIGLVILAWYSVRRTLEPLRRLGKDVEALDEHSLHERIRPGGEVEELEPIKRQLNHLLERLERAFQREKRFSGDVAHELKTPISELRAMSEVGKEWSGERDMVEGFFGDLVNLADDMERTVSNLLTLARLDAGNQVVEMEDVDLERLVAETWSRFRETADQRGVVPEADIDPGLLVRSDEDELSMMLMNIISNAVAYAADGTTVSLKATDQGNEVTLEVGNVTHDLREDDLSLMRERFWRKDPSRTGSGHAGLGLSLVHEVAQLLGLRVDARLDGGSYFVISISGLMKAMDNDIATVAQVVNLP